METGNPTKITVQTTVKAPVEKVWKYWNEPQHITQWSFASEDWHAPSATNDLRPGGKLVVRMEAKDGSAGFDFSGTYDVVNEPKEVTFTLDDGRKVNVVFTAQGDETLIVETFDAESSFPVEYQQAGWQAILDNFKRHVEQD